MVIPALVRGEELDEAHAALDEPPRDQTARAELGGFGVVDAVQFFPIELVDKWNAQKPEEFAPGFRECWAIWRKKALAKTRRCSRPPEITNEALPNPATADSKLAM